MMVERKLTQGPGDGPGLIPDWELGPFLPMTSEDIDAFNDIVGDEIDSAFSSTICCCDFCYEDFRRHWPEVAFREMAFQTKSMEVGWFLENSRLIDLYSPAEMSTLRYFIRCPRCGRFCSHNLWFYEHLFSNAPEIETAIDELLVVGSTTPFLMLDLDLPGISGEHFTLLSHLGLKAARTFISQGGMPPDGIIEAVDIMSNGGCCLYA